MKTIPLTQGKVSVVDDEDYVWLNQWKWCAWKHPKSYTWYAIRNARNNGKHAIIRMHRQILGLKFGDGIETDHKDLNGLNNCRDNIRIATRAENNHNQRVHYKGTSKFKGVYWNKNTGKWRAKIAIEYRHIHLGLFHSEIEAARTYDSAAKKYFGEFAHTNFQGDMVCHQ